MQELISPIYFSKRISPSIACSDFYTSYRQHSSNPDQEKKSEWANLNEYVIIDIAILSEELNGLNMQREIKFHVRHTSPCARLVLAYRWSGIHISDPCVCQDHYPGGTRNIRGVWLPLSAITKPSCTGTYTTHEILSAVHIPILGALSPGGTCELSVYSHRLRNCRNQLTC